MSFKTLKCLTVSALTFAVCTGALAGPVEDEMKDFFNSNGLLINSTSPGKYKAQAASHYTMGSVYARTPIRTTQIAALRLPSARAGCGGIDLFGGAFSFINSDELVNTMKAIGNNALALSFQLAIESISPVIAEKIEDLRQLQQEINSLNINSCETAAALVGSVWGRTDAANRTLCSMIGNKSGRFSDYAASRQGCGTGGAQTSTLSSAGAEYDDLIYQDTNYAWEAIKKSEIANDKDGNWKDELAELIMTLSGTIIITAPASDDDQPTFKYINSWADDGKVLDALFTGGTLHALVCDEPDKCLNPVLQTKTIAEADSMYGYVDEMIETLRQRLDDDAALQDAELAFLNRMTIPVYKILQVEQQYGAAGSAVVDDRQMKELIALDLLYGFVEKNIKNMRGAMSQLKLGDDQHLKDFTEQLQAARLAVRGRKLDEANRGVSAFRMIQRVQYLEKRIALTIPVLGFVQ